MLAVFDEVSDAESFSEMLVMFVKLDRDFSFFEPLLTSPKAPKREVRRLTLLSGEIAFAEPDEIDEPRLPCTFSSVEDLPELDEDIDSWPELDLDSDRASRGVNT